MGITCANYFKVLYGMILCRVHNKNEGLALEKAEKRNGGELRLEDLENKEDINPYISLNIFRSRRGEKPMYIILTGIFSFSLGEKAICFPILILHPEYLVCRSFFDSFSRSFSQF